MATPSTRHSAACARCEIAKGRSSGRSEKEGTEDGEERELTVFATDDIDDPRVKVVSKVAEGRVEFAGVDAAAAVLVKVAEDALPVLDVFPKAGELRARVSTSEHASECQMSDGVWR